VYSKTVSIPWCSSHSVFIDDFKVYCYSVLAGDLWICRDSVFENSMQRPWLYFCYRFDAAVVNSLTLAMPDVGCHSIFIDDFKVYSDSVFADDLWISSDITFLTIPCVSLDSIFAINLMRLSWIHWRCRLHITVVTQYSWTISRFTVTLFVLPIYGSAVPVCFWQFHA